MVESKKFEKAVRSVGRTITRQENDKLQDSAVEIQTDLSISDDTLSQ